jgi:hypothetical protein
MAADDDPLYSVLVAFTKRKLSMGEVYEAVGLGSSQYNDLRKARRLLTPDRIVNAARHFGINPVALLAECQLISPRDAVDYVEERRQQAAEFFIGPLPSTATATQTATTTGRTAVAPDRTAKLSKMPLQDDAAPL